MLWSYFRRKKNYHKALQNLEDLVEYEPTQVDSSSNSERLLTAIAGGDYWKEIVRVYQRGEINGYQAEMRLSTMYRDHLRKAHTYVLDMPIRLKNQHRPKYRMIHVSDHPDACFLMAENMLNRKNELFLNVQSGGQMSMFESMSDIDSTVEGDYITKNDVEEKVRNYIRDIGERDIRYTRFMADFYNRYGLICRMEMVQGILNRMQDMAQIKIIREPAFTETTQKPSTFWTDQDSKKRKVTIRRLQ